MKTDIRECCTCGGRGFTIKYIAEKISKCECAKIPSFYLQESEPEVHHTIWNCKCGGVDGMKGIRLGYKQEFLSIAEIKKSDFEKYFDEYRIVKDVSICSKCNGDSVFDYHVPCKRCNDTGMIVGDYISGDEEKEIELPCDWCEPEEAKKALAAMQRQQGEDNPSYEESSCTVMR